MEIISTDWEFDLHFFVVYVCIGFQACFAGSIPNIAQGKEFCPALRSPALLRSGL